MTHLNIQKKECVAIFTRGSPQQPIALIPTVKPSVVTRWCPLLFKLKEDNPKNYTTLNYYMVLGKSVYLRVLSVFSGIYITAAHDILPN